MDGWGARGRFPPPPAGQHGARNIAPASQGGSTARAAAGDEEDVEGAAQGPAGAANGALDEDEDMAGGDDPQGTPNGHGGAGAAAAPPRRLAGSAAAAAAGEGASTWAERAKYIPMRLEQPERRLLRLLEAALNVSEYTDKVRVRAGEGFCRWGSAVRL